MPRSRIAARKAEVSVPGIHDASAASGKRSPTETENPLRVIVGRVRVSATDDRRRDRDALPPLARFVSSGWSHEDNPSGDFDLAGVPSVLAEPRRFAELSLETPLLRRVLHRRSILWAETQVRKRATSCRPAAPPRERPAGCSSARSCPRDTRTRKSDRECATRYTRRSTVS